MRTVVTIPNDIAEKLEQYRREVYPDLTIQKMLIRLAVAYIAKEEKKK